ncbi:hypothetical protein MRX96_051720 [Rhipicephalus microplus]
MGGRTQAVVPIFTRWPRVEALDICAGSLVEGVYSARSLSKEWSLRSTSPAALSPRLRETDRKPADDNQSYMESGASVSTIELD